MKCFISIISLLIGSQLICAQQSRSLSIEYGFSFNKTHLIDNDNGYFFADPEELSTVEDFSLFINYSLIYDSWILEFGLGWLDISSQVMNNRDFDQTGFIAARTVEEYSYWTFNGGVKYPLRITKFFEIHSGLHVSLSHLNEDAFSSSDREVSFATEGFPVFPKKSISHKLENKIHIGVGADLTLIGIISKRIELRLWGNITRRTGLGQTVLIQDLLIEAATNEIIQERNAVARPKLSNYEVGIGLGYRF